MIYFSPDAKEEILAGLSTLPTDEEYYLRIGIKGTSCTGSLIIGFDLKKAEDTVYVYDEIPVIIDKKHVLYVVGARVNFDKSSSEILISVGKD